MDRSKELCDFEPLIDFTGTPNRGICETIHELPNEESSDVSLEMNNEGNLVKILTFYSKISN